MESFGLLVLAPLWGVISFQLLIHGIADLACTLIYFAGFLRGQVSRAQNLRRMMKSFLLGVLWLVLLALGFWLLATKVDFAWSKAEQALYGIFGAISAFCMLSLAMGKIRRARYLAITPGAED